MRFGAEPLSDERVVGVVGLFLRTHDGSEAKGQNRNETTHVAAALQEYAGDLALLDVGQAKLEKPFASVDVVLRMQASSAHVRHSPWM